MHVPENSSPETAIKIAYDFGRSLRAGGAAEEQISLYLSTWVEPFSDGPLYRYLRAGFTAGYHYDTLPWRRDIEAREQRDA